MGVLCGVVWWWLAPLARADVDAGAVYLRGHQELQVAQDCWFAVVLGALGVITATVHGWRLGGHGGDARGPGARDAFGRRSGGQAGQLVLLAVAVLLAGVVAWRTGEWLGPSGLAEQVAHGSQHPVTPLRLHTAATLLVGPFLFAFTAFLAAVFGVGSSRPDGGRPGHRPAG